MLVMLCTCNFCNILYQFCQRNSVEKSVLVQAKELLYAKTCQNRVFYTEKLSKEVRLIREKWILHTMSMFSRLLGHSGFFSSTHIINIDKHSLYFHGSLLCKIHI